MFCELVERVACSGALRATQERHDVEEVLGTMVGCLEGRRDLQDIANEKEHKLQIVRAFVCT